MENNLTVYNEYKSLAVELTKSEMCPAHFKKAQDAWWALLKGKELGLSPIYSLENIAIVKGHTALAADAMFALVKNNAQYGGSTVEASSTKAKVSIIRNHPNGVRETTTVEFTLDEAKIAGLYPAKDNWRLYPQRMLRARCVAWACREAFPDLLAGLLSTEEADAVTIGKKSFPNQPAVETPSYEVMDTQQPEASKEELLNLMRECTDAMNAFSMPSTERNAIKEEMAKAYKDGDGEHLAQLSIKLREKAAELEDKSREARKPMPPVEVPVQESEVAPVTPDERPEESLKIGLVEAITNLMNAGKYETKHVINSLRKNFPDLVTDLADEDLDWAGAIWKSNAANAEIIKAAGYYADAYKRELKKTKQTPKPEPKPFDRESSAKIIDGILTREEWDMDNDFNSDIVNLWNQDTEESHRAIMSMIGAKAGDITKVRALLNRHDKTLQDFGIFGDVQPEHLGKKEIGRILFELEAIK